MDPDSMFRAMTLKALRGWVAYWNQEPWGAVADGLRTGMLATATADLGKDVTPDRFVVATPTPGQKKDREEHEEAMGEFGRWLGSPRRE